MTSYDLMSDAERRQVDREWEELEEAGRRAEAEWRKNNPPPPPPTPEQLAAIKERHRREREEKAAAEWRRRYERDSGVVGTFRDRKLDSFQAVTPEQVMALESVRHLLSTIVDGNGSPAALWLLGPPGTGKTLLSSALVTELWFDWKLECHITTPSRLIRRLRNTWSKGVKETEEEVLRHLATIDLLVLDDIGTGWSTEGALVQLAELVDLRWASGGAFVMTSNLDVDSLRDELGPRTVDRLRDGACVVPLVGASYRKPLEQREIPK